MSWPSRLNEKLSMEESPPSPPNCEPKLKLNPLMSSEVWSCLTESGSGLTLSATGAATAGGAGGGKGGAEFTVPTSAVGSG